ncbi:MFS transporter [Arcanobacterium buesumense]|uniref:MFS transporter n=1 Tax=Arcanobacterium buesumense TaxID=2722751 RepID=A0A6H2EMI7_9ACTO|nr:MFS transporter [Arcanobacterium buesumense]QJC22284.1 MFS transporter [Arcanobacterium buesumense]
MSKHLDDVKTTRFLKKVIAFSSGGPFLEGYVLSIVSVAFIQMKPDLNIDQHWSGLIGVAALVGLTFGALVGGWATDILGRKKMFIVDLAMIIFLSLLFLAVDSPLHIVVLRFLIGVAIGADYPIATAIIAEFAPRRIRAICLGIIAGVWYLGANVALIVGYVLMAFSHSWRWMLASSVVPCVLILIGRWSIPESPRWLHMRGRQEEAQEIIDRIYGPGYHIDDEVTEKTSYRKLFQGTYLRRVLFVSVIWLCQVIPMFAIYTYGPQIMAQVGLADGNSALIGEVVIGTMFLLGTIPAMILAEHWGRRPLIIWSFVGMTVSTAVLGIIPTPHAFVVVICFSLYALFSGGPGNLQWLYPNELFPTDIRASAMGLATAFSRIGTVVSIYILPSFLDTYGKEFLMIGAAVISLIGLAVSIAWAPETRGLPLSVTSSPNFEGK